MLESILLPEESQLCIDGIEKQDGVIVVSVSSTSPTGLCPCCQAISERVHSSYQRHLADLPIVGCAVCLDVTVRRFFCDNNDCELTIFAERMPALLEPYARRTDRLASQQHRVAFALGGEAGASLLAIMGMAVSPDTLLRLIRNAPEPEVTTPRVLGVDDWAKRKGHSYGTILVDLEAHRPVDLLPENSAESLDRWLKQHPGVEIISRDRGVEYIKGATNGAPDAIQVADRWHLLTNLRDALERLLESKRACLKAAAEESKQEGTEREELSSGHVERLEQSKEPMKAAEEKLDVSPKLTKAEKRKQMRQVRRQERYEAVKELHECGLYIREIARRLKMNWRTVSKYVKADECPMYASGRKRPSKLDPYIDYMTQRWESGCHNATQIWRGAHSQSLDDATQPVLRYYSYLRHAEKLLGSDL